MEIIALLAIGSTIAWYLNKKKTKKATTLTTEPPATATRRPLTADTESNAYNSGWNDTISNMRATTAEQARNYAEKVTATANKQWADACDKIDSAYTAGRTPAASLFAKKDHARGIREAANAINGGTYGLTVLTAPGCIAAPKF